ncbi:ATP-binding protein [Aquabacterium sp. A7-Y]|uniref:hybrid sensor histidine kinase/response regulator n=1 Tax=Aquabacterium sp. A7-Y TaxID=1349605 RepID=UPI00223DD167|nr:ATP-binding protein [Aquabacterium sp. A7-Y]MCW7538469.1 ATP-binding protein [Aquabacterium sp. A7-Y]
MSTTRYLAPAGALAAARHAPPLPGSPEMRWLLDRLPAAAYACDAEGLITHYNDRALRLWGRAPSLNDAADRYCGSFRLFSQDGTPISHADCWMARALREQREFNGMEILIEREDGSRWTALAHANPFHDEQGVLCGAVNVLVDITERKRAEALLREADRNKNEFLAMLSHELRNPLAPIRNGLHIMRLAPGNAEVANQACDMMERQMGHMVRLIDDLLDLSRITRGKIELRRERVELAQVLRDAVEASRPQIEAAQHRLELHYLATPLFLFADRTRLAQVVSNLLINSAKYTPAGGLIGLLVERHESEVTISVRDNGMGIPPELLPHLFEIYTQGEQLPGSDQPGLGIGLSLVRGLVALHEGTVEARSEGRGRGSEFRVRLPLAGDGVAVPPIVADTQPGATGASYRVLVVDDNHDAAVSLALMLELMGHRSVCVHDGEAAVASAAAEPPDVILLDLGLPRVNGFEACRRIRAQPGGDRPVLIAMTGWGQEEDKRRSREAGFDFHMVKPVDPETLERLLAQLPGRQP